MELITMIKFKRKCNCTENKSKNRHKKKRSNKIALLDFDQYRFTFVSNFRMSSHLTKELLTPFALPASIAVLAFSCITLASRHTTTPLSRASKKLSPDTISESETWKEGEKKNDRKSFTVIHTNANFCCSSRGSRNTFPWNDILIFASAQRIA